MQTMVGLVFSAAAVREKGGLKAAGPLPPAFFAGMPEKPPPPKKASVELVFSAEGPIRLRARVSAELDLECARCGGSFSAEFTEAFDEVYEDTVEFIDARGPVIEAIALMAPMKPLCSAACKGLCPACGRDLNRKTCACPKKAGAPPQSGKTNPFAALKNLGRLSGRGLARPPAGAAEAGPDRLFRKKNEKFQIPNPKFQIPNPKR